MARPGFVLEVDERTPPLVVESGEAFLTERFPLGTRVVYPAEPLPGVPDLTEAVDAALDEPLGSDPLASRLRPGMRLVLAVDDLSAPLPRMRRPDLRGRVLEAVLTRAARAGVDDVTVLVARGLHRRMTDAELQHVVGERVFRSFHADGLLRHHDAEDTDALTTVGSTADLAEVRVSAAAADADLLVMVRIAGERGNGAAAVAAGLGSTATVGAFAAAPDGSGDDARGRRVADVVAAAVPVFLVELVLDDAAPGPPFDLPGRREWEWGVGDRAAWLGLHRGLAVTPARARRRLLNGAAAGYRALRVSAGDPALVAARSTEMVLAQRLVEVAGPADVAVVGVGHATPYSQGSVTNPVLAAWSGLAGAFGASTGRPVVRAGGALVLYHPLTQEFSGLNHPSYVDFFAEVLATTTDPVRVQQEFEPRYATDPWYRHLYADSEAFHGVHPLHLWYATAAARAHCGDIVWVGADRASVERLGFRAASTLADALEIVSSTVGRSPSITYLHQATHLVADVR